MPFPIPSPGPPRSTVLRLARCCVIAAVACASGPTVARAEAVDFERDVQPLLEANCFECHGPDEQEGGLRLDARASVFNGGDTGPAVEPGSAADSLLIERIRAADEDERMPQDADPLDAEEIALLERWIEQGAAWPEGVGAVVADPRSHWAYTAPERPALPPIRDSAWPRNEIDRFVLARIEAAGWTPAPEAERARLLRRVYLDLTGLPPGIREIDAFLADRSPDAYEKVVERLLASPHYGERWAVPWLDAARYADSHGFQIDNFRTSWPYRDWVINALNTDMPFDRFTIEQLAGDLLPNADQRTRVATGFHRAAPTNLENGADPEEYRVGQVVDRVNVTGSIWLGATVGCAQCHDHKYDPISHREYYQLFAFFNNTPIESEVPGGATADVRFVPTSMPLLASAAHIEMRERLAEQIEQLKQRVTESETIARGAFPRWKKQLVQALEAPEGVDLAVPLPVREALAAARNGANEAHDTVLVAYYLDRHPGLRKLRDQLVEARNRHRHLQPRTTLVMKEIEPRETHVLERGHFLDRGERVRPATLEILHPMPEDAPRDRLGLARWLVAPDNPLVARVTVNRTWAEFFGRGIVTSLEDFGLRGEPPTHPALLDWLAVEFVAQGWSMKQLHRQIVSSATYRQSSDVRPALYEADPDNALYARGPRLRLAAEFIRDNALAVSGLLDPTLFGPPVRPPQPEGFWRMVGPTSQNEYVESKGSNRYRRGLYTVWRRSAPYPSFTNFDAPDRAASCLRRSRSNTALQALNLLNDPVYVEAAAALARRMQSAPGAQSISDKLRFGLRLALAREPSGSELQRLEAFYRQEVEHFTRHPHEAQELIADWSARSPAHWSESASDLAAWFFVANALLNLDEVITRG